MKHSRAVSRPGSRRDGIGFSLALTFLFLGALFVAPAHAQNGLQLDGSNDYVTIGAAPTLGTSSFTVETWFRRTGAGVATSTGSGGVTAVPLVTKGRAEADASTADMNYFLGIRGTDSVLVADYEEGTGQTSPGLNHPIVGVTALKRDVWYHAAATFDGTTLRLYLNGALEATVVVGASRLPQSASTQHAALGSALTTAGTAAGFFAGTLDEPRVWNVARAQLDIQNAMLQEVASGAGLIGRWGLNEGTGTSAASTVGGAPSGTLTGGPTWAVGASFGPAWALFFSGTTGVAALGNPAALGLSQYTIECWFRRDGAGAATDVGAGSDDAIPLIAHGRGDQDTGQVHVNWFLGIRESDGVLMTDFEESSAGATPSLNHPTYGTTALPPGSAWHHAAATYDGTTLKLYLDGALESSVVVGQPAGTPTVMPASIGSALDRNGEADGFFHGVIDEARVWNLARSQAQIQSTANTQIAGASAGLVARWGLNEGTGSSIASSAGTALPGTLNATGWSWVGGAPFNLSFLAPAPPTALAAVALSSTTIRLTWTDNSSNESRFEIERSTTGVGGPFTPVDQVSANVVTFDDGGRTPGSETCYRVRAANGNGNSNYTSSECATTPLVTRTALDLAGNTYVTFGDADVVDLAQFTVECWFRRDGAGTTTTTGTGGVTDAIPMVTNGRGESEVSNVDLNWFLGLRAADGVLIADFEEGAGGTSPSLNHPVIGVTPIAANGVWHHAAASYDGGTWSLYLDGNLEATVVAGQPVASLSTQHNAIGSALTSTGTAAGFFEGAFDEVRVWNSARSLTQIRSTANGQLDLATSGLVARWSLDDGSGTAVASSAGTIANGTISGVAFTWIGPAPFDLAFNTPPAVPTLNAPASGATGTSTSPTLSVSVSDADGDSVTVTFYGRAAGPTAGPDFTLLGIPDTQFYTSHLNGGSNAILFSQMNWTLANRASLNIPYMVQLGDCVQNGDNGGSPIEWLRADSAWKLVENPLATTLADGIPYGICVGNHDQSPIGDADGTTTFYNQYFGSARYAGRAYYGGHYGGNNDNWFDLFSAGGLDFLCIGLEYDTSPDVAVLNWADSLMKAYPSRRAFVASHNLLGSGNPGTFSTQGSATYNALRDNPNFFMMLCGHVSEEGRRVDTFEGRTVHTVMSDYQARTNGGNGWLRLMNFSPANNVIRVRTYSPWLVQFEADSDSSSQFTLAYDMSGGGAAYQVIGSVKVASGEVASLVWSGRTANTAYQWYAVASDGPTSQTGPTWSFTTGTTTAVPGLSATEFAIGPVIPNPTRGAFRVSFALPQAGVVRASLHDVMGREVAVLADRRFAAGRHELHADALERVRRLSNGIYFVRVSAAGSTRVQRVAIVQ
ncbi:MAG: T9SS type A sorting domain-containing protein [Candidatus Eisenbacteria bacterium]|uniref:T9SS type A sorting domain-containing protein n=1 Tax=Eiseniibacteriota bacterium TaxID=2212470 RepID=A0A849SQ93_UNCEI|nr:T9SS type A sorting domain-containing protein [Candidatus Eisenbacteria bacterium]